MIQIVPLSKTFFHPDSLDEFERTQQVNRIYRCRGGEYVLEDCVFTEDWDFGKKRAVAEDLSSEDMIAWLALDGQKVVGFIGLQKAPVGTCMILDVIQVSAAYRGQGIGRKLFEIGRREARKAGAEALYISACPAEETIAFYFAMGAKPAESPIREIAEAEPDDLQLICPLLPDRE